MVINSWRLVDWATNPDGSRSLVVTIVIRGKADTKGTIRYVINTGCVAYRILYWLQVASFKPSLFHCPMSSPIVRFPSFPYSSKISPLVIVGKAWSALCFATLFSTTVIFLPITSRVCSPLNYVTTVISFQLTKKSVFFFNQGDLSTNYHWNLLTLWHNIFLLTTTEMCYVFTMVIFSSNHQRNMFPCKVAPSDGLQHFSAFL